MSHTSNLFLALGAFTLFGSCQKDDGDAATTPPAPTGLAAVSEYSNLQTGNYWVWQRYKVDSADVVLEELGQDSIHVLGDSVVDGVTYTVVERLLVGGSFPAFRLWRDSLSYLITSEHEVLFCTEPLDQVIYSVNQGPVGVIIDYTVHSTPVSVTVPAGTFSTQMMRAAYTSVGGFPEQPEWKELRSHWAEGVGRVRYYEFYSSAPWGYRYDLVRYHVN